MSFEILAAVLRRRWRWVAVITSMACIGTAVGVLVDHMSGGSDSVRLDLALALAVVSGVGVGVTAALVVERFALHQGRGGAPEVRNTP